MSVVLHLLQMPAATPSKPDALAAIQRGEDPKTVAERHGVAWPTFRVWMSRWRKKGAIQNMKAAATWEDIGSLTPWDKNPRHNAAAIEQVRKSIERFGFSSPIIARQQDRVIIAGHTRHQAALKMGLDKVPVRFLDLDPAQARALALADNRLGEVAEWNDEMLSEVLAELEAESIDLDGLGWSDEELDEFLNITAPTKADPDEAPPSIANEVFSALGEVYELGPHRLVCGDSTDPVVWSALLQDGELLRMVWTDPPYGVAVNAVSSIEEARALNRRTDGLIVQNDAMTPEETAKLWHDAFTALAANAAPGSAWYAAGPPGPISWRIGQVLEGFQWKRTLVWVKDQFAFGRGDYHYRHEIIFHGWFEGAARLNPVPRNADTVCEVPRPKVSKEHPTMKPIELIKPHIENSTQAGWIVGDPFGGSGSTLMACSTTGRRARLIELDPRYCDVIRRRWTAHAIGNGIDPGLGALEPISE